MIVSNRVFSQLLLWFTVSIMGMTQALAETVHYYSLTNPNTPHLALTETWIKQLKQSTDVTWYPGLSCGGKAAWDTEQRPKAIEFPTGRFWQSLDENNTLCTPNTEGLRYISLLSYNYAICAPVNSRFNTLADVMRAERVTMAHSVGTVLGIWTMEFNRLYGGKIKPVTVNGSANAWMAAQSGDTDLAFIATGVADRAQKAGQAKCFATTAEGQPNSLTKLASKIHPLLNTHGDSFPFAMKGVSDSTIADARKAVEFAASQHALPPGFSIIIAKTLADEQKIAKQVRANVYELYELTKSMKK